MSTGTSWQSHADRGRRHFTNNEYSSALASYRQALTMANDHAPRLERSIILSNIVACRLKLGGDEHLNPAVDEAKECIALNKNSAKGHVRLASVYLAMGDHSNDACQALQSAIQMDSTSSHASLARSLLAKELRRDRDRDRVDNTNGSDEANGNGNRNGGRDDLGTEFVELDGETYNANENDGSPSAPPMPENERSRSDTNMNRNINTNANTETQIHVSWMQTIHHKFLDMYSWYQNSSENTQTIVHVLIVFLILYVAFAIDSWTRTGSSGDNNTNAYEQFRYNEQQRRNGRESHGYDSSRSSRSSSYGNYDSHDYGYGHGHEHGHGHDYGGGSYGSGYGDGYVYGYGSNNYNSSRRSSRRYGNDSWDAGSYSYIIIIVIIAILHSLGVPIHAIAAPLGYGFGMRRRRFGGGFGFGNMGMGMGRGGYRFGYGGVGGARPMFGRRRW